VFEEPFASVDDDPFKTSVLKYRNAEGVIKYTRGIAAAAGKTESQLWACGERMYEGTKGVSPIVAWLRLIQSINANEEWATAGLSGSAQRIQ
jgi:hypothetical protein